MVALVVICETNTGTVVEHDVSNLNFGNIDAPNITIANNPVNRGDYSFEKYFRYHLHALSGSNQIDNFQVWLANATDTGVIHDANLKTTPFENDSYDTPVSTISSKADIVVPTADPTAQNIGVGGATTPLNANDTYTDYIVSQVETQGGASPGDQTSKTWNFEYDEQ